MRHPLVLALILVAVGGLSWWLASAPPAEEDARLGEQRPIDYYLRGLQATTMDPQGQPARTLQAAEIKHFTDDDTTELTRPQLTVHQGEQPPWEIEAEHGWVSADGELILLSGQVDISRAAAPGIKPLQLQTRNLRVQPRQDYAETDEKVRVRSNSDRLDATGMQAWFRQPSRIKFLADVKGLYAPPQ